MSVLDALSRFHRKQFRNAKKLGVKTRPPCPWRPTPIEALAGGVCSKCGYPTSVHRKENRSNVRNRKT